MEHKRKRLFHILAHAWCIINLDGPEVLPSTTAVTKTLKEKQEPEKLQKALMDGILRVLGQTYADYPEICRTYTTVAEDELTATILAERRLAELQDMKTDWIKLVQELDQMRLQLQNGDEDKTIPYANLEAEFKYQSTENALIKDRCEKLQAEVEELTT
ncbi:hypothetical protein HDV00_005423 [Rhizophlyctis rosea]|nr:hypothetical protein HDV00_005423 [Rhizophlyctis rosea]